jgi:3-phosphoshikimate 1-carboxyvinyltransferase
MVRIWPLNRLRLPPVDVPGDFSSGAFFVVAALLVGNSEVCVESIGLNPTRTGLLRVLERMGAQIEIEATHGDGAEPVGRIQARTSHLQATDVQASEIPGMIDEVPLFLLAAAKAKGTSRLRGAGELRAKESDRLAAMARLLSALGVDVLERPDGLDVTGLRQEWSGGSVHTVGDHRLAMVAAIAGMASRVGVLVDDTVCIAVSYPGFIDDLTALGGRTEKQT